MPVDDQRLERALRDAAPNVGSAGAFERIAAKRAHRRALRTARLGGLATLGAIVVVVSVVLVARDEQRPRVTTPPASATEGTTPLSLDGETGYLRGPLTVSGDLVSVAAYETRSADGGFDFPPSRIVRFDRRTLDVIDRVDLKAEILSVADGANGVRWAITRNEDPEGPVKAGTFLKRIAPDGHVESFPLPPGTEVTGDVVVEPQRVLVPTRAGALPFGIDGTRGEPDGAYSASLIDVAVPGFVAEDVHSGGGRTWITGTLDDGSAVALVDGASVVDTITLPGRDVSFAWVDDNTVLATTDGRLVRIAVRR
jgi:hypothetical protein